MDHQSSGAFGPSCLAPERDDRLSLNADFSLELVNILHLFKCSLNLWCLNSYLLSCWLQQTALTNSSDGHSTIIKTGPGSVGVQTCSGRICKYRTQRRWHQQVYNQSFSLISVREFILHLFSLIHNAFPVFQICNEWADSCCTSMGETITCELQNYCEKIKIKQKNPHGG